MQAPASENSTLSSEPPTSRRQWWFGLTVSWVLSLAFMLYFLDKGWIPHDDGSLAHGAERVLAGEVPHRDFVDGYTGGVNYLNALAFKIWGIRLLAIRYALFVVFACWVPIFYRVASRFAAPVGASCLTMIAAFWSVPNYPAAMPSWYNLFLATAGVNALLEYAATRRRSRLVLAGLLGGLSILAKTHGALFVAAGLLFLIYEESAKNEPREGGKTAIVLQLFPIAILACGVLAFLAISWSRRSLLDVYQFAIPGLTMIGLVARRFVRSGSRGDTSARIITASVFYLAGTLVPVVAFVGFYAAEHALPSLARDILILPTRSIEGASIVPSIPVALIPIAMVMFAVVDVGKRRVPLRVFQGAVGWAGLLIMLVPKTAAVVESFIWVSLAEATPVIVPLLAWAVIRSETRGVNARSRSQSVLVGSVAALCSLVQYPFAAPIYFAYSLPLLVLAVAALLRDTSFVSRRSQAALAGFYLGFGALYIAPMALPGLRGLVVRDETSILALPRGGLRIDTSHARIYPEAVELLRTHAASEVIYAGPDAPELYFLTALKNPTPAMFDYLVMDSLFHQTLVQNLDSFGVNAVAIRKRVVHSPPLEPEVLSALATKFPVERDIGRFIIRWR